MDNIKISVTYTIPGSVMYSENKESSKPRKCKPAMQSINMTDVTYEDMIRTPCNKISPKHWKRMTEPQRVIEHLKLIQHDLNAINFEFTIYDD